MAEGTYISVSQAADALKVSKTTLHWQMKGGQMCEQAHEKEQVLTCHDEKALVKWISDATAGGNPVDRHYIMEMVQGMRENQTLMSEGFLSSIENHWIRYFL